MIDPMNRIQLLAQSEVDLMEVVFFYLRRINPELNSVRVAGIRKLDDIIHQLVIKTESGDFAVYGDYEFLAETAQDFEKVLEMIKTEMLEFIPEKYLHIFLDNG